MYKICPFSTLFLKQIFTNGCRHICTNSSRLSSNRCSLSRINRSHYARMYPTTMVLADGSSITIRYKEPRSIIKMPLDLSLLTESERRERIKRRQPKKKIVIEEEIEDDSYNIDKYKHLWKKK